jgi:S-adenosylmethionine:diacylglycerol 3-amino-3-carboxypropyl transferase
VGIEELTISPNGTPFGEAIWKRRKLPGTTRMSLFGLVLVSSGFASTDLAIGESHRVVARKNRGKVKAISLVTQT